MSTDPREFEHPIDGTGGNVPPLVEVIADVLLNHRAIVSEWTYATCNCDVTSRDTAQHAKHQARAVVAAISEAGAVEWGWEYQSIIGGDYGNRITRNWGLDRPLTREESQAHVDAMNKDTKRPDVARLVSRITGPWERAE